MVWQVARSPDRLCTLQIADTGTQVITRYVITTALSTILVFSLLLFALFRCFFPFFFPAVVMLVFLFVLLRPCISHLFLVSTYEYILACFSSCRLSDVIASFVFCVISFFIFVSFSFCCYLVWLV